MKLTFKKNDMFFLLFMCFFLFLLFFKLLSNLEAVIPCLFYIIGAVGLLFYLRFTKLNRIIVGVFVFYYLVTLHLPFLYIIINYTPLQIHDFMTFRLVTYDDYLRASIYIFTFDLLLILFFSLYEVFILNKLNNKCGKGYVIYNTDKKVLLFFLFLLSVLAKLYLMHVGVWFFYEMNHLDTSGYKFLSYAYMVEKLDFIALIYIVYKFKIKKANNYDILFFILVTCVSLFFAFLSTSKAKIIMVLLPSVMLLLLSKNKKLSYSVVIFLLLIVQPFFSYMTALRHTGGDLSQVEVMKEDTEAIFDNKVLARLDYQTVLSRVLLTYPEYPDELKFDYLNNFTGLIPRAIWPSKPVIGLDTNKIGYEIGFLSPRDNITAVGITPIGVSYYLFGYAGVFVIAFFISTLIFIFSKFLNVNSWLGFFLSLMVSIELARNGTYVNIVPSLVQTLIIFTIVGILLNNEEFNNNT